MAGWSNHLDGAKALIRLRGKDVITESTPEGLEMFQLVRSMSVCNQLIAPALSSCQSVETTVFSDNCVSPRTNLVTRSDKICLDLWPILQLAT